MAVRGRPETASKIRFWRFVKKTDNCWEWLGHLDKDGYGQFSIKGHTVRAHRFSYELLKGKIPEGLVTDHVICKNLNALTLITWR